jgi:hypothetical protein
MELQIYAVAALWMAAKYESTAAPGVSVFIEAAYSGKSDNVAQLRTEVIAAEVVLLRAIDYRLSLPTIKTFLSSIMQRHHLLFSDTLEGNMDKPLYYLCGYLGELALHHYKTGSAFQPVQQLQMASAIYMYALVLLKRPLGHAQSVTLCQLDQLYGAMYVLVEIHSLITKNIPSSCSVWIKYAAPAHRCVATIPPVTLQQIAAMSCCPVHGSSMQCGEALSPASSSTTAVAEAVVAG